MDKIIYHAASAILVGVLAAVLLDSCLEMAAHVLASGQLEMRNN